MEVVRPATVWWLRIGVGINTGVVIAGTIGGGGKLEFTLIGDTVNVAARVEQLTKTTGDAILLTHQFIDHPGSSTGDRTPLNASRPLCRSSRSHQKFTDRFAVGSSPKTVRWNSLSTEPYARSEPDLRVHY